MAQESKRWMAREQRTGLVILGIAVAVIGGLAVLAGCGGGEESLTLNGKQKKAVENLEYEAFRFGRLKGFEVEAHDIAPITHRIENSNKSSAEGLSEEILWIVRLVGKIADERNAELKGESPIKADKLNKELGIYEGLDGR